MSVGERNDGRATAARGVAGRAGRSLGGFKKFLLRGNVVDLAVGIVIGAAFTGVVQAFVKGLINPLIGLFGGTGDLSAWVVTVSGARLLVGDFLSAVLSFLLVALVVYFLVVVPVGRLMDKYRTEPQPASTKECSECLSKIPELARRCAHCGAQLDLPSEDVQDVMRRIAAPSGEHVADEAARVLVERLQGDNGSAHRSDPGR